MAHQFSTSYTEDSLSLFRYYKKLGEGAMEQLSDEQPVSYTHLTLPTILLV